MHDLLFLVKVICVFALEPLRVEARLVGGTSNDRQVDGVVMDVSATSHGVPERCGAFKEREIDVL